MNGAMQTAIYTALTADATLVALVEGIYDDHPQDLDAQASSAFPYVTIGDDIITPFASDDWSGGTILTQIDVWSRYAGRKEAKAILDRIRVVLDRATLSVTGYEFVTCDFAESFVDLDPDGETRHGVIQFRTLLAV